MLRHRGQHVGRPRQQLPAADEPHQRELDGAGVHRVGIGNGPFRYGHLPLVTGEGNRKLSKRDPESNLFRYRERGFLPEGLLNYLALLGWAIAEDRDVFSLAEMVTAFDVSRVSSNAARFRSSTRR